MTVADAEAGASGGGDRGIDGHGWIAGEVWRSHLAGVGVAGGVLVGQIGA